MWTAAGRAVADRVEAWEAGGDRISPLDLSNMDLTELPPLPAYVMYLNCSHNKLTTLEGLPSNLMVLECEYNDIVTLGDLPLELQTLQVHNCLLEALPALPPTLRHLLCGNNNLRTLPALPIFLLTLSCHSNKLRVLPALPSALERLVAVNNEMATLPPLPAGLTTLSWGPRTPLLLLPAREARLAPIRRTETAHIVDDLPPLLLQLVLPNWECVPERAPPLLRMLYVGPEEQYLAPSVIQAAWCKKHEAARRRLGAILPSAAMLYV